MVYLARNPNVPLTWEEYKIHIDLYKTYLDYALKAIAFFYAIAGTILTVIYAPGKTEGDPCVKAVPPVEVQRLFVVTPFIVACTLAGAFLVGAFLWGRLTHHLNRKLECQCARDGERGEKVCLMFVPPFTHVLTVVLSAFGVVFVVVAFYLWGIIVARCIPFW